jgi:hypothetical protein
MGCSGKEVEMTPVLIAVSAADGWALKDENGDSTSYWVQEPAEPHKIFASATARTATRTI